MEAAILAAIQADEDRRARFLAQREPCYAHEGREREERLLALHRTWFEALGLASPVERAFASVPGLLRVDEVVVVQAGRAEGADLGAGHVLLRLQPERLLAPAKLEAFLHHEFMHVADLLDPAFGHPEPGCGALASTLQRDRYALLWDVSVDGRLSRLGLPTVASFRERWRGFRKVFRVVPLGTRKAAFRRLFKEERPAHAVLAAAAAEPHLLDRWLLDRAVEGGSKEAGPRPGAPCPLCRFPTHVWASASHPARARVQDYLRSTRPGFHSEAPLCAQCFDRLAIRAGVWPYQQSAASLQPSAGGQGIGQRLTANG